MCILNLSCVKNDSNGEMCIGGTVRGRAGELENGVVILSVYSTSFEALVASL